MQKGQISLELVIVLIVALTAVSVVGFLAQEGTDTNQTLLLQNQAKVLAHTVSQKVSALAILQQTNSGTLIEIPTQPIQGITPTFSEKCTLRITNSLVIAGWDWKGNGLNANEGDIIINQSTILPSGFVIMNPGSSIPCGDKIMIGKT